MSRRLATLALLTGTMLAAPALAEEAFTTRIEPRPYYGASVTLEAGVRVFRPLPVTRQVIINPGGQTPLSLGYYDTRVFEQSQSMNYNYNYDMGVPRVYGLGGFARGHGHVRGGGMHHHDQGGSAARGF